MTDLTGQTIGNYEIHEEIGRGGMATVYRATQTAIGREVAVKVLPAQFLQDKTFLERFTREVKVIADLQHPRILPIYDFGEHEGVPYIVMAYMAGGTLADRVVKGPMALGEIVRLTGQIAEGLDHAHRQGVIHRDFKPSNVLLDRYDNVHLSDFGIARVSESTVELTASDMVVGTPAYMAPEMARKGDLTPAVDVYALGVTLYQMLAGRLPYVADTPIQYMMAHVNDPVPNVRELRRELSIGVQAVVEKAMSKRPEDRFRSAGELAQVLAIAAGGELREPDADRTLPMDAPPQSAASPLTSGQTSPMGAEPSLTPGSGVTPREARVGVPPAAPAVELPPARRGLSPLVIGALAAGGFLLAGVILVGVLVLAGAIDLPGSPSQAPEAGVQPTLGPPAETPLPEQPGGGEPVAGTAGGPVVIESLTGRIAFTRNENPPALESNEIYVLSLPDGNLTRLTTNEVADWIPRWSPDGQAIAFTSFRAQNYDLWVMGADGSQPLQRIALPAWDDYPAWSPDGSRFAFSSTGLTGGVGNSEIFVGSSTGDARRVTTNTGRDEWPAWSPDGTTLANSSDRDGDMDIYLFPAGGGEAIRWTDEPGYDDQPAWSPDGEWIAFVRKSEDVTGDGVFTQEDDTGYGDVWIGRRDGSEFVQLTFGSQAAHPAWSPDGQYIVYARFRDLDGDGVVGEQDGSDLWVIAAAGGDPAPLLEGTARDWAPDWAAP